MIFKINTVNSLGHKKEITSISADYYETDYDISHFYQYKKGRFNRNVGALLVGTYRATPEKTLLIEGKYESETK